MTKFTKDDLILLRYCIDKAKWFDCTNKINSEIKNFKLAHKYNKLLKKIEDIEKYVDERNNKNGRY